MRRAFGVAAPNAGAAVSLLCVCAGEGEGAQGAAPPSGGRGAARARGGGARAPPSHASRTGRALPRNLPQSPSLSPRPRPRRCATRGGKGRRASSARRRGARCTTSRASGCSRLRSRPWLVAAARTDAIGPCGRPSQPDLRRPHATRPFALGTRQTHSVGRPLKPCGPLAPLQERSPPDLPPMQERHAALRAWLSALPPPEASRVCEGLAREWEMALRERQARSAP